METPLVGKKLFSPNIPSQNALKIGIPLYSLKIARFFPYMSPEFPPQTPAKILQHPPRAPLPRAVGTPAAGHRAGIRGLQVVGWAEEAEEATQRIKRKLVLRNARLRPKTSKISQLPAERLFCLVLFEGKREKRKQSGDSRLF